MTPTSSEKELRFECTHCGECCTSRGEYGYVYVTDKEVTEIARHLGMLPMEFRQRYTFVDEYGWTQIVLDQRCVFLKPDGRCGIYPARPLQCRTFPFWPDLVRDGAFTDEAARLCEGVGQGKLYQIEDVEPLIRAMERQDEEE